MLLLCSLFAKAFYHMVYYFAVDDIRSVNGGDGTPSSKLSQQFFFGDSDEFRDATFKLIPQVVQGNFIVRKAVGSTPAIMGKKLRQLYVRNERFMEVILDCCSSPVASGVIRLTLGYSKTLVTDMGFVLEGDEPDYLPERIFGCIRSKNVEMTGPHIRHVHSPPPPAS
jgi:Protein ENHANCED DISEASE RESISTANCE 2, C-terminal